LHEHSIHHDEEDAAGVRNIELYPELMLLIAGNGITKLHMRRTVRTIKEHDM
jgi:hypothetical protein